MWQHMEKKGAGVGGIEGLQKAFYIKHMRKQDKCIDIPNILQC